MDFSRRDWLVATFGLAAFPEILEAQKHAHGAVNSGSTTAALEYLDASTAKEIEAMVERILPSDDTPGAKEAGVIYFIDRALTTFDKDKQDAYREGLTGVQAKRKELFPESASIAALGEPQQIELLKAVEHSDFFQLLRFHTLAGFLGDPSYGGNRDQVGWKLIGFEHAMMYQPPFGYYDRAVKEGRS
jgi:gluconate 2-dehydrogenase gamma chain